MELNYGSGVIGGFLGIGGYSSGAGLVEWYGGEILVVVVDVRRSEYIIGEGKR